MEDNISLPKFGRRIVYCIICYCIFWMGVSYSLLPPLFPKKAEEKGVSPTAYGWIIGTYTLTNVVAFPVAAIMVPLVKINLCHGATFVNGWSTILLGVLGWSHAAIPFAFFSTVCVVLNSIGYCVFYTSSAAFIAEVYPEKRLFYISIIESFNGASVVIGSVLGELLCQLGDYQLPFFTAGVLIVFGFLGSVANYKSFNIENSLLIEPKVNFRSDYKFIRSFLACASGCTYFGFNASTLEPHIRKLNLAPAVVGSTFSAFAITYSITSSVWGTLCDRTKDPEVLIIASLFISFFGNLLIGPVPFIPIKTTIWSVIVAQFLLGSGVAGGVICCLASVWKTALENGFPYNISNNTLIFASLLSSASVGATIGSVLGGVLLDYVGFKNGTLYIAAIQALMIVFIVGSIILDKIRCEKESLEKRILLPGMAKKQKQNGQENKRTQTKRNF